MEERRKFQRQKSCAEAQLGGSDMPVPTRCVVKDISPAGAHLLVDSVKGLPSEFKLDIGDEETHACFVRWRDRVRLGVVFLPPWAARIEK